MLTPNQVEATEAWLMQAYQALPTIDPTVLHLVMQLLRGSVTNAR